MNAVWKYELRVDAYNSIELPKGATPLTVQVQNGNVCLWCSVNPNEIITEKRLFRIAGTGHPIKENNLVYISTFQLDDGAFVGHVFEIINN